ncbi:TetR family transcriptional regulator [Kitasatospora sp. NPDC096147]|uniref:TetR family transcriptional regulator n=1 Tax=Kitasatospora sp. NPDC096147 TaxID=3364093 RepID=UPI0038239D80
MARLTRAEQQQRTRAAVLVAARQEFAESGYVEAKVDRIAERAELTRGAVYSNFTGKRALYLAVLVDAAERARGAAEPPAGPPASAGQALGAFARVWLERLPFLGDTPGSGHLQLRSLSGVLGTEPARTALAELARFEALLLGLALSSGPVAQAPPALSGTVRRAGLALTLLHGAAAVAENAPGVGDPFDLARAAEHLAGTALGEDPEPPHLAYVAPARPVEAPWSPPGGLRDEITGGPVGLADDGVVVVLGAGRLSAAGDVLHAADRADRLTVVVVTGDPDETGRLARLRIVDLVGCLRRVFPPDRLPRLRVVLDDTGAVPAALAHLSLGDADPAPDVDLTETAVRVRDGLVTAHATGRGAGHAAARHRSDRTADRSEPA